MSYCAPAKNLSARSCFTDRELRAMAESYNQANIGPKINIYTKDLWAELHNTFFPICKDNEGCWIENQSLLEILKAKYPDLYTSIRYYSLKPLMTEGKHDWLSTTNIDEVMHQYEKVFSNFKYLGAFPSDYYKEHNFPISYFRKYKYVGLIFNTDPSYKSGSHWVAVLFETCPDGELLINYFDSTGDDPNRNIKGFLNEFKDLGTVSINKTKHQRGNSECGMYSMYFILSRLQGRSMEDINKKRITDAEMNLYRSELFRPRAP